MKEYIVTRDVLNIRSSPTDLDNTNFVGSLKKGESVFLTDELIPGKKPENGETLMWRRDNLNRFVSNDGVTTRVITAQKADVDAFEAIARFPGELIDWNNRVVKVPGAVKNNFGAGISLGVLDTGIEKQHLDMLKNVVESKDYTSATVADLDIAGHGTGMASLIAAYPYFNGKGINGIASNTKLYIAKVMYDENDPGDFLSVENAFNNLLDKKVDIINMSIGRPPIPSIPAMQNIAQKIADTKNAVFFAACKEYGDDDDLSKLTNLFPANCPGVIPVCTLTRDLIDASWASLPSPLIIIPDFNAWCCSIKHRNYYFQDSGSSIATALMSGITALLLSDDHSIDRTKQGVLTALEKYASTIDDAFANPGNEVHFIIKQ